MVSLFLPGRLSSRRRDVERDESLHYHPVRIQQKRECKVYSVVIIFILIADLFYFLRFNVRLPKVFSVSFPVCPLLRVRCLKWQVVCSLNRTQECRNSKKVDEREGGSVAEWFRALDLKSGVPWFKSSTLLLFDRATGYRFTLVFPQVSQTHDSRNRSNINDLCTRIE